jgi:hypothetical protein
MIESGLSNFALTNTAITAAMGNADAQRKAPFAAFYFSVLAKNAVLPGIILDRLKSPDAEDTLDARTPLPGTLIEGIFQFGSVANDNPANPLSPSGYLSACLLSQALRRQLAGLATGKSELPDGTLVKDVFGWDEFDAHYEVGGLGYLFRRVLQVTILFQETK